MQDITRKNFEAELVNASIDATRAARHLGRRGAARASRSGRCWKSSRPTTPAASSWSSSTPTPSPRSRSSSRRCSACAASRSACCCRAASRSTASSAPCPRARSASSSTSTCRPPRTSRPPRSELHEAEELLADGDSDAAIDRLQAAVATNPANDAARYDYLRALLAAGRVDDARKAFEPVANAVVPDPRLAAAGHWLAAMEAAPTARPAETLAGAIAANKRDFDARFELAQALFAAQRLHPGDGRAARDRDARQGLEATAWRARPTSRSSRS